MIAPASDLVCKLATIKVVGREIDIARNTIRQELIDNAGDPIKLKRRFRMMGQIGALESQIYKKIYDFKGGSIDDYLQAIHQFKSEVTSVVDRSS